MNDFSFCFVKMLLQIISGSYERLLYGFSLDSNSSQIEPTFIYPSHISSIKCLASSGKYLASGSSDEHIKLYDINRKKEIGSLLMQHTGSINCLAFHQKSHLLSASVDGTIAIYRTSDWERLKTLTGHKGSVHWISIHPTGKLALSIGKDSTIKCWDLSRGLCARSSRLQRGPADRVLWNSTGSLYALVYEKVIEIIDIEDQGVIATVEINSRINGSVFTCFTNSDGVLVDIVVVGCEDATIQCFGIDGKKILKFASGHKNRVKDISVSIIESVLYLATCSSDGCIKLWSLSNLLINSVIEAISSYETNCRLTCISIGAPGRELKRKMPDTIEVQSDFEEIEETKPSAIVECDGKTLVIGGSKKNKQLVKQALKGGKKKKVWPKRKKAVDAVKEKKKE